MGEGAEAKDSDEGIKDAQGAHECLVGGDGEVAKGNYNVLLGLDHIRVVVVEETTKGSVHLRVLLRQAPDLNDGFGNGLQFRNNGTPT